MYKSKTKNLYYATKDFAVLIICVFCIVSFFMRADIAYDGIRQGLLLCYNSLIPALFPFFIMSKLILNSRFAFIFGLPLLPYTKYILKIKDKKAATALFLGLTGGFGAGAVCLNSLYTKKLITNTQAKIMLCTIINAGPAFVIACVGADMLGSSITGILLYVSLCSASLICGVIALFLFKNNNGLNLQQSENANKTKAQNETFVGIVREAVVSILYLCGFVVFFCFFTAIVLPPGLNDFTRALLASFLEVTNATSLATSSRFNYSVYLCCFALSFLGASAFLQVRNLISHEISIKPLFISRFFHTAISLLILHILLKLFPFKAPVYSSLENAKMSMPYDAACIVFFMCCSFFCLVNKKGKKL